MNRIKHHEGGMLKRVLLLAHRGKWCIGEKGEGEKAVRQAKRGVGEEGKLCKSREGEWQFGCMDSGECASGVRG